MKKKVVNLKEEEKIKIDSENEGSETKEKQYNISSNNKHRGYMPYEMRLAVSGGLAVFALILGIIFIFFSLKVNVDSSLKYYQTSNLDYKVNLKENEFYEEEYLDKNMQYIASLIDDIEVNFDYQFSLSEKMDYKYSYGINAEVKITDPTTNNVIFVRNEKLIEEQTVEKLESSSFPLHEKISVDYQKYNDIAKTFKSKYVITANSNLIVTMYIRVVDKEGNEIRNLNANNKMTLTIPLAEQMININMNYQEINNSDTFTVHKNFVVGYPVLLVLGIIFVVASIVALIILLKLLKLLFKKQNNYDKTLSKILREYDRIIVATKNEVIDSNKDIIDVDSFNELLDARDNLEKPIIFKEIHKHQKCEFIVKNSYEIYRYIMKNVDLDNKRK